jgi:alcohol dehydrogenase class IV
LNPGHPDLIPDVVILDPQLTLNVPKHITAFTGLDALTHAIEAYVSTQATMFSDMHALQAIELITANIQQAYHEPGNLVAKGKMLLGSFHAGVAFSNASTNLAHALGRALGAKFQLSHGLSVALMHPFVVAYSMESSRERYQKVAQTMGLKKPESLIVYLEELNNEFQVWANAASIVSYSFEDAIDEMTKNALEGNGILTNRRLPGEEDIRVIYKAMGKRLQKEA